MRKIFFFICLLLSFVIINNLVRSIYSLSQKQNLITSAEKELEREKAQNASLKGKLQEVEKPEFIEQQARDRLFLAKPGEQIVLLPQVTPMPQSKKGTTTTKSNWEQWVDLLVREERN